MTLALALLPAPTWANVGVPLLALTWPVAWLLLVIIIPLEAWVAERVLGTGWLWSLKMAVRANLVSTALGFPVVWGLPALIGFQDLSLGGIARELGVPVSDGHYTWLALATAAVFCVPTFLGSVGSEYLAARRAVEPSKRRLLWRWAWTANALSYMLVFALAALYFQYAIPSWYGKAWQAACLTNLKVIAKAVHDYQGEHQGRMPRAADFAGLIPLIRPTLPSNGEPSSNEERWLRCPATGKAYVVNTALSGVSGSSIPRLDEVPLLRDAVPHSRYGFCVVFADGHGSSMHAAERGFRDGTFR